MTLTPNFTRSSAIACACLLANQVAPRPKNTYHSSGASAAPRLASPEVRPDRTIVFRLRAPEAAHVTLSFAGSKPMSKDDAGVWSVTVGPVDPEIYQYNFVVDGVRILDPGNPNLKNGRALDASIVEVPGTPPRFDELLAQLREKYDFVIVDSPPLLVVTDASVIAPAVDGVILVVRMQRNARRPADSWDSRSSLVRVGPRRRCAR